LSEDTVYGYVRQYFRII